MRYLTDPGTALFIQGQAAEALEGADHVITLGTRHLHCRSMLNTWPARDEAK